MAAKTSPSSHAARVFTSVFPIQSHSTPTPEASPALGFPLSPGTSGSSTFERRERRSSTNDLTRQATAWSTVTRFLKLSPSIKSRPKSIPYDVNSALRVLLENGRIGKSALHNWFFEEIRRLYANSVTPEITKLWASDVVCSQAQDVLARTARILVHAQSTALANLELWVRANDGATVADGGDVPASVVELRDAALARIRSLVLAAISKDRLLATLSFLLHTTLASMTGCSTMSEPMAVDEDAIHGLLLDLRTVGLLGDVGQRCLATAVKAVIDTYVESYAARVDWIGRTSRVEELQTWLSTRLEPAINRCLVLITNDETLSLGQIERDQWQKMAINSLGLNRGKYLLSYVQMWDQSMGAVLDLREYIKTAEAKQSLAAIFVAFLEKDLLHAGAKTSELLSIYVNMIKVFKTLDNRGVLLEKVAQPLRQFLREREDTVKVIAVSFLADLDDKGDIVDAVGAEDVCAIIAKEVVASEEEALHQVEKALDYDDMEWQPDPIDAGPDWKRSKSNDIISYMLTLFEQEAFIKEMQNILGERLLRTEDSDLEKETRLVELFKSRLGSEKLQHCEVMLRDMQDSSRIMGQVRWSLNLPSVAEVYAAIPREGITFSELARKFHSRVHPTTSGQAEFIEILKQAAVYDSSSNGQRLLPNPSLNLPPAYTAVSHPQFYAQILSGYFWPELRDDQFSIPAPIAALQSRYETKFTSLKHLRKLQWLSALGRATVELSLNDRDLVFENVTTWQATVIYAFQPSSPDDLDISVLDDEPATRTVEELETSLEMDETLLRAALTFWVGKRVLVESAHDTFTVLESLPADEPSELSLLQPQGAEVEVGAVKSQDAVLQGNKEMYQMFMIGMLTNGGAMDAGRVAMMMKMVVPGGFNFGEDEVRWLLCDLVEKGRVVEGGGVFGVKK